ACCLGEERAKLAETPQRPAYLPGRVLGHADVHVGEDEILPEAAAADDHLPEWVHDIAVAVADAIIARDPRIPGKVDVVAAHDVDAILHGSGHEVRTGFLELRQ